MKFYLKCTHIGKIVKGWFRQSRYELQLVSIAIACESGANFFEVSNGFETSRLDPYELQFLPPQRVWKSPGQIAEEVKHFIDTQAAGEPIEFVGFRGSSDFVTFASLFGGHDAFGYPTSLPGTITNVDQSLSDFVELMDESFFGPESEFPTVMDATSLDNKKIMFQSHPRYPHPTETGETALKTALWIKKVDQFLSEQREGFIQSLKLPEIEDENDNR